MKLPSSYNSAKALLRPPSAGDALGATLRDTFHRDQRLPSDMASLLASLDDQRGARAH